MEFDDRTHVTTEKNSVGFSRWMMRCATASGKHWLICVDGSDQSAASVFLTCTYLAKDDAVTIFTTYRAARSSFFTSESITKARLQVTLVALSLTLCQEQQRIAERLVAFTQQMVANHSLIESTNITMHIETSDHPHHAFGIFRTRTELRFHCMRLEEYRCVCQTPFRYGW